MAGVLSESWSAYTGLGLLCSRGRHILRHAIGQHLTDYVVQRTPRGQHLGADFFAWAAPVQHALHGAYLALGAPQTVPQTLFKRAFSSGSAVIERLCGHGSPAWQSIALV